MKAVIRKGYGSASILTIEERPIPEPSDQEILIRVHASTVNRTDIGVLTGSPYIFRFFVGWPSPRHASTGTDFAGVIEKTGSGVTRFKAGDRVWGFHDHGIGSHAQYFCISAAAPVFKIPETVSFDQAAASAEGAHYAYNYLRCMHLNAGDEVMVNGGTGAIGSAAIQMLVHKGVQVTATAPGDYIERVRALGASVVIDYQKEDFTRQNKQFAYVLDAVGKSSFGACKKLLKPGGIYFSSELGPGNENLYLWMTTRFSSRRFVFTIPKDIPASLGHIQKLLESGQFRPLIDREFTLDQIREAFTYTASGQKIGNVIIRF